MSTLGFLVMYSHAIKVKNLHLHLSKFYVLGGVGWVRGGLGE